MKERIEVGIDLMGSDQPPQAIFEAVLQLSQEIDPTYSLVVFLHASYEADLKKQFTSFGSPFPCVEFVLADEVIQMDESPLLAVRRKKHSTMALGMHYLQEGRIQAFVSTGNTGALITTAMLYLPRLPTIDRPALLVMLPNEQHGVVVLDVGANVTPKPQHLLDYAKMGVAYRQIMDRMRTPKVGLLNIGAEEQKGTKSYQEAYQLLSTHFKNSFRGNIEGKEVFHGKIDVLITDGFTGNVFLKTCEGVSLFLMDYLRNKFAEEKGFQTAIKQLHRKFNYTEHPGAFLCGVEGIVIKCHGYSNAQALKNGIRGAIALAELDVINKIKAKLT